MDILAANSGCSFVDIVPSAQNHHRYHCFATLETLQSLDGGGDIGSIGHELASRLVALPAPAEFTHAGSSRAEQQSM